MHDVLLWTSCLGRINTHVILRIWSHRLPTLVVELLLVNKIIILISMVENKPIRRPKPPAMAETNKFPAPTWPQELLHQTPSFHLHRPGTAPSYGLQHSQWGWWHLRRSDEKCHSHLVPPGRSRTACAKSSHFLSATDRAFMIYAVVIAMLHNINNGKQLGMFINA